MSETFESVRALYAARGETVSDAVIQSMVWSLNISDEEYSAIQNGLPWPPVPVACTDIVPYVTNFLYPKAPVKTKTPVAKKPKTKTPKTETTLVVIGGGVHMKHSLSKEEFITEEWARQWLVGAVPDDKNLFDVGTRYVKGMWHLAKKGTWRVPEVGEKMSTSGLQNKDAIVSYLRLYRKDNTPE
jgi:hypothetical protein